MRKFLSPSDVKCSLFIRRKCFVFKHVVIYNEDSESCEDKTNEEFVLFCIFSSAFDFAWTHLLISIASVVLRPTYFCPINCSGPYSEHITVSLVIFCLAYMSHLFSL